MSTRVFVYGSLLAGQGNHALLERHGARFECAALTTPGYRMYHLGGFPGVVAGGACAIAGEVYHVDAETLVALDRLEGHPRFYRRTRITLSSGAVVETYLLRSEQVEGRPLIESGNWKERA